MKVKAKTACMTILLVLSFVGPAFGKKALGPTKGKNVAEDPTQWQVLDLDLTSELTPAVQIILKNRGKVSQNHPSDFGPKCVIEGDTGEQFHGVVHDCPTPTIPVSNFSYWCDALPGRALPYRAKSKSKTKVQM